MTNPAVWYFMRGSGVVALLLLTAVVVLGIAGVRRARIGALPPFATRDLHRNLSLLSLLFLGVHVLLAVVDPDAAVRFTAAFVPFVARASPFWVGLGAIGTDLVLLIAVTSLVRRLVSRRTWRRIHLTSYAAWPFAWLHGLGMGSDATTPWLLALEIGCLVCVLVGAARRLDERLSGGSPARAPGREGRATSA